MKLARQSFLVAGLFLAAACGSSTSGPDQYQSAVPTFSGLSAEVSGAVVRGREPHRVHRIRGGADRAGPGAELQASTSPEWLPKIRDAIRSLNQGLKDAFGPVERLVLDQGPVADPGQVYTYGPYDKDGFSYLLSVVRVAGNHYAWKLEVKKTGDADSAYVRFAAGTTFKVPSDQVHRGRGTIGIDLDAYKTVVTTYPGQGKLFVAFSHHGFGPAAADAGVTGQSKTLVYALRNFSADTSKWQPVDAVFYAHKNGLSGVTSVRVASYADIPEIPNDTPAKELLLGRARFNPGVGGRAEVADHRRRPGRTRSSSVASAGTGPRRWSSRRPRSARPARSRAPAAAPGPRPVTSPPVRWCSPPGCATTWIPSDAERRQPAIRTRRPPTSRPSRP